MKIGKRDSLQAGKLCVGYQRDPGFMVHREKSNVMRPERHVSGTGLPAIPVRQEPHIYPEHDRKAPVEYINNRTPPGVTTIGCYHRPGKTGSLKEPLFQVHIPRRNERERILHEKKGKRASPASNLILGYRIAKIDERVENRGTLAVFTRYRIGEVQLTDFLTFSRIGE